MSTSTSTFQLSDVSFAWDFHTFELVTAENGLSNVVKSISWILTASVEVGDTTLREMVDGVHTLKPPAPDSFTDFDSLTKDIVESWIESLLNVDDLKNVLYTKLLNSSLERKFVRAPWYVPPPEVPPIIVTPPPQPYMENSLNVISDVSLNNLPDLSLNIVDSSQNTLDLTQQFLLDISQNFPDLSLNVPTEETVVVTDVSENTLAVSE